jgi:hypothetical protein
MGEAIKGGGVSTVDLRTRENQTLPSPKNMQQITLNHVGLSPVLPKREGGKREKPSLGKRDVGTRREHARGMGRGGRSKT